MDRGILCDEHSKKSVSAGHNQWQTSEDSVTSREVVGSQSSFVRYLGYMLAVEMNSYDADTWPGFLHPTSKAPYRSSNIHNVRTRYKLDPLAVTHWS